jgi:tetraacyldisaccharide 4'-kinase
MIYWMIVVLRNKLYDWKILKSKSFSTKVISVGNLSVGGTGKSPTIEYLIRLLKDDFRISTLSRGYGRRTKGFVEANSHSSPEEIGDEPTQFKQKFNEITVTVCEDRAQALQDLEKRFDVVLMDDAFQHRRVKPGIQILLFDYNKIFDTDWMMPLGNLREPMKGRSRANIILVTKTPKIFSPMERRRVESKIQVYPHQQVFYSYLKYGELSPLHEHPQESLKTFENLDKKTQIILITGIANPSLLLAHFEQLKLKNLVHLDYPDHYRFTQADIEKIRNTYTGIASDNKIIITTEKDAMRLRHPKFENALKELPVYYLPIESELHEKDKEAFDQIILNYVRSN